MFRKGPIKLFISVFFLSWSLVSCAQDNSAHQKELQLSKQDGMELATFGTGCFWCTEAIFQDLEGVTSAISGYSGGTVDNPTYREVCNETTGHAEVIQITYDPKKISFAELLEVFWQTHDPTTLNRQGNDVGTQYRSAIFYHNEEQRELAEKYKKELDASGAWNDPIVTEITAFKKFFPAEDYHQNYYNLNGSQPYCTFVIKPKVEKFRKVFKDKLKKENKI
ncbi:peptide-methionine (S)-S-oxide reductase MsrA [Fulvivirgaceae bacterium BMA10]|uniref:Peptide methionine sulfoxide reductase MsrA n=1 Tax=Splendidivirga corallicola TaxID=3051826 RepID=A0ABT8KYM8_9BACT|nr:peptide-methionine (S)-S-oxide reductase MsrA [Fulvivirgaceae bacterium BMA10]